jgi:hypothetical protein
MNKQYTNYILKIIIIIISHQLFLLHIPDSPKLRNKGQKLIKNRPAVNFRHSSSKSRSVTSGTMVVVNKGNEKKTGDFTDKDPDVLRLQVSKVNIFIKYFRCWLVLVFSCVA